MNKFAVISPTHIPGKKKESWERFREGGYIAFVSKLNQDLKNKSVDEIIGLINKIDPPQTHQKVHQRQKNYSGFFALDIGDYVAVNNTNDGLFGIGIIKSGYYYKERAHNTGSTDPKDFYSHFRDVDWVVTDYMKRKDILEANETGWPPYGIITLMPELPGYIRRILKDRGIKV